MLTNHDISMIKPTGRLFRIRVDTCLLLEVSPKGGKWWRIRYVFNERENNLSLGTFPDVGIEEALVRRDEVKSLIKQGIDPSAWRKLQKIKDKSKYDDLMESINAERQELLSKSKVRVSIYNNEVVVIAKGKSKVRFTSSEAVYIKNILEKLFP